METFLKAVETFLQIVTFFAELSTIAASGIAIYLFVWKREAISSAFRALLNFSLQLTLSELKDKLERLNDLTANDPTQAEEIVNGFSEIVGQLRGNSALSNRFADLIQRTEGTIADRRRLTEPKKRTLVSELRERLRHINVEQYGDLIGD